VSWPDGTTLAAAAELWGLHGLGWQDLLQLMLHFMLLSMIAVGGAITAAPDMHRYLVQHQLWLGDAQFTASVAIAQAAPGPNILFVGLLGLHVAGFAGLVATMAGILLPSSLTAWAIGRWGHRRADSIVLRAFTAGMVPLTIGLLLATGWVLTAPTRGHWGTWVVIAATVATMVWTKLSPLWLIAAGAIAGMAGLTG
jgi:chromate transporter